jgi:predicted glycoside hydrolase/deacetylase ChbG (UPF0249 family)
MLIINADDWGRSPDETDAALSCHRESRITSVSAMVFMRDSERAADLAKENGVDVGLHLNLNQRYDGAASSSAVDSHNQIARFLSTGRYALLIYHPGLKRQFRDVVQVQLEEFARLYGKPPSHVDGHQHRHLCANMLVDKIIPSGQKVRRNFSFLPGEKGLLNRSYRRLVDWHLGRNYRLTDSFFSLGECLKGNRITRVIELAKTTDVELMTHPVNREEYAWLTSDQYLRATHTLRLGSYSHL